MPPSAWTLVSSRRGSALAASQPRGPAPFGRNSLSASAKVSHTPAPGAPNGAVRSGPAGACGGRRDLGERRRGEIRMIEREELLHAGLEVIFADLVAAVTLLEIVEPVARDDPGVHGEIADLGWGRAHEPAPHHLRENALDVVV